jgi:hypothetical protein
MGKLYFLDMLLVHKVLRWMRKIFGLSNNGLYLSFHGLTSFYIKFVKDFNALATSLTKIVKKFMGFKWGKD